MEANGSDAVRGRSLSRRCRLLVAGESVVEDGGRPVRVRRHVPCAPADACSSVLAIIAEASASLPCRARSLSDAHGGSAAPDRRRRRSRPLRHSSAAPGKSPAPALVPAPSAERWSGSSASAPASRTSWTCRAEIASAPSSSHTALLAAIAIPAPAQDVVRRKLQRAPSPPLQDRTSRPRVRPSISRAKPVEHQVEWMPGPGQRWEGPDGAADLLQGVRSPRWAHGRRAPRGQVGLARELRSNGSSRSRRLQQQRRSRHSTASGGERDRGPAADRASRALEARRAAFGLRRGQQRAAPRRTRRPGSSPARRPARAGRGASASAVKRRRPLEQRRCGREAAAALRSSCGALEVGGHGFVRAGGGERAVPRAAVGGELGIAHLRQRVVYAPSFVERRGSVDR